MNGMEERRAELRGQMEEWANKWDEAWEEDEERLSAAEANMILFFKKWDLIQLDKGDEDLATLGQNSLYYKAIDTVYRRM